MQRTTMHGSASGGALKHLCWHCVALVHWATIQNEWQCKVQMHKKCVNMCYGKVRVNTLSTAPQWKSVFQP